MVTKNRTPQAEVSTEPPNYLAMGAFVLALALASYLLRSVMPMGKATPVLGFPTPGYLPQYLCLFVLGVVAYRHNWFQTIRNSMGKVGYAVAVGATLLLYPVATGGTLYWLGKWDLAICGLCALGFNSCSRDVPGFNHVVSKSLQPPGKARQFPLPA